MICTFKVPYLFTLHYVAYYSYNYCMVLSIHLNPKEFDKTHRIWIGSIMNRCICVDKPVSSGPGT